MAIAERWSVTAEPTPPMREGDRRSAPRAAYVRPIVTGLLIAAAGLVPWTVLARMNARVRPDIPWAALLTVLYVVLLLARLNGRGSPGHTAAERRRSLRLWPPTPANGGAGVSISGAALIFLLVLLYGAWVIVGRLSPVPDLAAFPTTSYRWSMFIMGGLMSGVVEEAAYRGYMQTGLEKIDPANAVLITSLVFAASHITQGLGAVLLLGPGLFAAAMLYGLLARKAGTILPGMLIHVLGDLSYTFFGVLRGDGSLLFVS
ncbi:MAG TPA: CPBP family intramembrane glutamic endopeptidase [Longimicrobiales bacterium]